MFTCINTPSPSTCFAFFSVTDRYFAALGALEFGIRFPLNTPEDKKSFFIIQNISLKEAFKKKQAENGLQSQSSENGKTAVWHYGLKLQ